MNQMLIVLVLLLLSALVASTLNLPWTAALLFSGAGLLLWFGLGSLTRRYYQRRNNLDELSRQDIPATLWLLSLGSVGYGLSEGGHDVHDLGMDSGWASGDAGSMSDGGGGGGGGSE